MTRVQRLDIGIAQFRTPGQAAIDPCFNRPALQPEHPQHQAQSPEILAPPCFAGTQVKLGERFTVEPANIGGHQLIVVQAGAVARIYIVASLFQVTRRKTVVIDNDERALLQQRQTDLQRSRVERHEHIRRIAGCRNPSAAKIDLVSGHTKGRSSRCANLRRKVRERRKVGTGHCRRRRELRTHKLNTVTRITGKTDDN